MRSALAAGAALLAIGLGPGCGREDRLAGTPKDLPPGFMNPAPPLQGGAPRDVAKSLKGGRARPGAKTR
jgi:hypothetical protein